MSLDSSALLSKHLLPYQFNWVQAEENIHAQGKQAIALAEKSVRIGWTWADAFKNVRKNPSKTSPPITSPCAKGTLPPAGSSAKATTI